MANLIRSRARTRGIATLFVALLEALACLACGTPPRTSVEPHELRAQRQAFVRLDDSEAERRLNTMLHRMELEIASSENSNPPTFDILIIHGGGTAGAFTAGFLEGWGSVDDPKFARPSFDVVTGSSSGALIAPFVFVGRESSYKQIVQLFSNFPPEVFRSAAPLSLLPTRSSYFDNSKLAQLIRAEIDTNLTKQIVAGTLRHRMLNVVTTDLDLGLDRVWDLGFEARRALSKDDRQRLHKILLASTALPLAFPPVEIDGRLHADGGIAYTMFPGFDVDAIYQLLDRWRARHPGIPLPKLQVWAIVNQHVFIPEEIVQPRYLDIASRTVEIAMQYDRIKTLFLFIYGFKVLDDLDDIEADFRYVAIPPEASTPRDLDDLGDVKLARELIELGRQLGADPSSWQQDVPKI